MAFFTNFCHCQGLYFRDVLVPLNLKIREISRRILAVFISYSQRLEKYSRRILARSLFLTFSLGDLNSEFNECFDNILWSDMFGVNATKDGADVVLVRDKRVIFIG